MSPAPYTGIIPLWPYGFCQTQSPYSCFLSPGFSKIPLSAARYCGQLMAQPVCALLNGAIAPMDEHYGKKIELLLQQMIYHLLLQQLILTSIHSKWTDIIFFLRLSARIPVLPPVSVPLLLLRSDGPRSGLHEYVNVLSPHQYPDPRPEECSR